ncbi:MAG: glycerol-3-phosphate 1-O-acyltransferase PlsY [Oscillospiraceae bacterium]
MQYMWLFVILIGAYLIGSISTAIIFGKCVKGEDIREKGSGNAGATNTLRNFGKVAAIIVTFGDCLKAVLAIVFAILIANATHMDMGKIPLYVAGVGAVIGHNFPIYFKFKGGKGILVSMVAILFANWAIGLIVIVISVGIIAITRYVSLGSVLGSIAFVVLACVLKWGDFSYIIFSLVLAGLAIFMHRANIKRLINGTESKLGSH